MDEEAARLKLEVHRILRDSFLPRSSPGVLPPALQVHAPPCASFRRAPRAISPSPSAPCSRGNSSAYSSRLPSAPGVLPPPALQVQAPPCASFRRAPRAISPSPSAPC